MKIIAYDRKAAVEYARKWAYGRNPQYYNFDRLGGDCTNYVSAPSRVGFTAPRTTAQPRGRAWNTFTDFLRKTTVWDRSDRNPPWKNCRKAIWYNWEGIREIFTIRPSSSDFRAGLSLPPTLTTRTTNLSIHTISNGCAGYTFSASAFPTEKEALNFQIQRLFFTLIFRSSPTAPPRN